ncbi:MAG: hypothetical protein RR847_01620 [Bacilli bacterium]
MGNDILKVLTRMVCDEISKQDIDINEKNKLIDITIEKLIKTKGQLAVPTLEQIDNTLIGAYLPDNIQTEYCSDIERLNNYKIAEIRKFSLDEPQEGPQYNRPYFRGIGLKKKPMIKRAYEVYEQKVNEYLIHANGNEFYIAGDFYPEIIFNQHNDIKRKLIRERATRETILNYLSMRQDSYCFNTPSKNTLDKMALKDESYVALENVLTWYSDIDELSKIEKEPAKVFTKFKM